MLKPALRSLLCALTPVVATACGVEPPLSEDASGTTSATDSSSGGVSATSTTGRPPTSSSSTTLDPSTTLGTSSGDGSDGTGAVFIIGPDGGSCAAAGSQARCSYCDPWVQDCGEGEKCVPWSPIPGEPWNRTRCSPLPSDPAGPGEPCMVEDGPFSGFDDCDVGLLCYGVDPCTLQGTCTPFCDPHGRSCGDDVCVYSWDYQPWVCIPRCDPLDPATCLAGETCRPIGDDLVCVLDVTLPQGLECGVDGQYCAPGEACMPTDELARCADPECCRPWCDRSAADPDGACTAVPGEVCRPFFDAPPAGYEHVGVCGLPPA